MPTRSQRAGADAERARLVGVLAHRVLEDWDFGSDPEKLGERVGIACRQGVPPEWGEATAEEIAEELRRMFRTFVASEPYARLRRTEVLGREVPFAVPWPESGYQLSAISYQPCVMEGVIDLLYRLDGRVWIADYKTDRVEDDEVTSWAEGYRVQADVYRQAVSRCLGIEPVGFQFVFLRNGLAVPM
jgi:ATP-dependent helicase/nuclease subunit A